MRVTTQLEHSRVEGDFNRRVHSKGNLFDVCKCGCRGVAPTHSGEEPETCCLHLGSYPVAMI